jgi:hypothetical protein
MLKVIAAMLTALTLSANNDATLLRQDALTVHEWGTFTTVAGPEGHPVDWLPLAGPADLPCFVDRFADQFGNRLTKYVGPYGLVLNYDQARSRLQGKVRMETPVLYFYAPRRETINVRVDFRKGLFTEWYPQANVSQPAVQEKTLTANSLGSRIEWNNVQVLPGMTPRLPLEEQPSHYYAARETDAAPVRVNGKDEKFLFYRGVGSFPVPLSVRETPDKRIVISATGGEIIPTIMLFENRGGQIGYRIHSGFHGEIRLAPPRLDAGFGSLQRELETILMAQGLYAREARAMVETWRDSWFEEGTRVFYIVPARLVDTILPLKIDPPPAQVARAFVGRMEVITSAMVKRVEKALAMNDAATLAKYGRFLGPIADRMSATPQIRELVDSTYKSFLAGVSSTCK